MQGFRLRFDFSHIMHFLVHLTLECKEILQSNLSVIYPCNMNLKPISITCIKAFHI